MPTEVWYAIFESPRQDACSHTFSPRSRHGVAREVIAPPLNRRLKVLLVNPGPEPAPGDRNITTYSSTSYWATFRGNLVIDGAGLYGMAGAVSAAAPLVAGSVALMLQRNPMADAPSLKSALQRSARADGFTGTVPNPQYGYGKLDIEAALAAIGLPSIPPAVSDCLFNWAERAYAQFFAPPGSVSQAAPPYYYRYYPGTGNYLGVSSDDNQIWILGPVSGGAPTAVGAVATYRARAGC